MGRAIARGAACATTLLLAGCSTILSMNIDGPLQAPVVTPERRAGPVCLSELIIRREGEPRNSGESIVWQIEGRDGECIRFDRIVYGQAPAGFDEITDARLLEEGVVYTVMALGGIRGPFGALWSGGGAYVFERGGWRAAGPDTP